MNGCELLCQEVFHPNELLYTETSALHSKPNRTCWRVGKKLSHSIIASSQLSLSPPRWSVQFVWTWISALIIIKSCVVVCYMRVSIFSKAFSSLSWTDFDIQYEWKKNVLILPVAFVHCSNMKH
ncbi:hypothetical protein T4B_6057 [Trichinella pseudospiralis]|uniref:Uncharacterized protein n=1 Tax=Trichinella pseudospiralis TaxID=6337 RepID=A0A0V1J0P0_TRIPS|nr:hypothetical protein T4B_6057 [Trichinella pseudospiralis]KRZ35304.1 hypothetical protein T4C_12968 [Trichinella pseudospiralis]